MGKNDKKIAELRRKIDEANKRLKELQSGAMTHLAKGSDDQFEHDTHRETKATHEDIAALESEIEDLEANNTD